MVIGKMETRALSSCEEWGKANASSIVNQRLGVSENKRNEMYSIHEF